jgi:hypothetical protein
MKNRTLSGIGMLLGLAMAGGCATAHTSFTARAKYNLQTRGVELEVADEAGINKVRIYRGNELVKEFDLRQYGSPSCYTIQTGVFEDGEYTFKIFDEKNGETDTGFFEKRGEEVRPEVQGCF